MLTETGQRFRHSSTLHTPASLRGRLRIGTLNTFLFLPLAFQLYCIAQVFHFHVFDGQGRVCALGWYESIDATGWTVDGLLKLVDTTAIWVFFIKEERGLSEVSDSDTFIRLWYHGWYFSGWESWIRSIVWFVFSLFMTGMVLSCCHGASPVFGLMRVDATWGSRVGDVWVDFDLSDYGGL